MTLLSREATLVQNPALGAVLVWRFACGYTDKSPTRSYAPLPFAFLVLPIILHADSFADLAGTRSGLLAFVDKFTEASHPRSDIILAIHDRAAAWRGLSLAALRISIRTGLLTIVPSECTTMPLSRTRPSGVPGSIAPLLANAEKLGAWFSTLSVFEISLALKVRF